MQNTELLVIGAGPYGLSVAAHAKECGISVIVVGEPMDFWKRNMPADMLLRSAVDWHLDADGVHTLKAFIEQAHIPLSETEPIAVEIFCAYAEWFRQCKHIDWQPLQVERLLRLDDHFEARCQTGETIRAKMVVATPGMAPFANLPDGVIATVPRYRVAHTSALVEFGPMAGKRCLIVGGRQSAFEWAALLSEAGAESIDLVYGHDTPRFVKSDWSFTDAMIENTLQVRGWFRHLDSNQRAAVEKLLWNAGRLQLEPWLWPRINNKRIRLWPNSSVVKWRAIAEGTVQALLNRGDSLYADHVLLATGYRMNLSKVGYLADEIAAGTLRVTEGFPALDEDLQTTLPGLYITGYAATRDFGPCFGFVRGCIASARIIVAACFLSS